MKSLGQKQSALFLFAAALFLSFALIFAASAAEYTPQQQQTIAQLKQQMAGMRNFDCSTSERVGVPRVIIAMLDDIDPLLVGKNVIFSDRWLDYIGEEKSISRTRFADFVSKMDRAHDAFADLVGNNTTSRRKLFIDISYKQEETDHGLVAAHAHVMRDIICVAAPKENFWFEVTRHGSWSATLLHEIGHMFAPPTIGWRANAETFANLKVAYALETLNARFGVLGVNARGNRTRGTQFRGNQYRTYEFNMAVQKFRRNEMTSFAYCSCQTGSAFDFYIYGLVDRVGWETYKKAFHSYQDPAFVSEYAYSGERVHVQARDFIDRLAFFSGKPDVLSSLPDRGALLDEHFPVTVRKLSPEEIQQRQQRQQQPQQRRGRVR